ncbi:MAG: response regulator [Phycisphaerales bacterium]|nr:response regulator [Phycisphaerales bacterium]
MSTDVAHIDHPHDDVPALPRRVMVADDEHLVAAGLLGLLEDLGYEAVGPANNAESAVSMADAESPDIALLDIRMPDAEGLTAAEQIYKQLGIPVIMVSAYSDPEYVAIGQRIGVYGYLLKPVTVDQLRIAIDIAWSRYLTDLDLSGQVNDLEDRLAQRKIIEQAKWIIVKRKQIPEPEAMRMLQKQARNGRKQLVEVAQAVIDSDDLLGD